MKPSALTQDLRYAVRTLERNPAYTLMTLLMWSIGIGATIAMFSVVYATLLRPLPFRDPSRLMSVFLRMPVQYGSGEIDMVWSYPKYQAFLAAQRSFGNTALHLRESFSVRQGEGSDVVPGESVGAQYFNILGVMPAHGRAFLDREDRSSGGDRVAVISDGYWRDQMAGAPGAIGSTIHVGGVPFQVVGIAPPGFAGLSGDARLWVLYTATRTARDLEISGMHQFEVVARLNASSSLSSAAADVARAGTQVNATFPPEDTQPWRATAYSLDALRIDPLVARAIVILAAGGALLLLIACVNAVNLMLARAASRRAELSVRLAIGASRGRIVRQLLTESVVLALAGSVAGLLVAVTAVRVLSGMAPVTAANLSTVRGALTTISLGHIALDWRATVAAVATALLTAITAGLVPAISASRTDVAAVLRQGTTAVSVFTGLRRLTARGALVITEVSLAVVLLVSSGLLIRSLSQLFDTQMGYRAERLLSARITLAPEAAPSPGAAPALHASNLGQQWATLLDAVSHLPGVVHAAVGSCAPVGDHCEGTEFHVQGRTDVAHIAFHAVSPGYFATLGTPILRGRELTADDRTSGERVILINAAAARSIWGRDDPLSTPGVFGDRALRVVGVAGDVRYEDMENDPRPAVFFPISQMTRRRAMLMVRTTGDASAIASELRQTVRALNRDHTVSDIRTMQERVVEATARNRFATRVLGAFAIVALLLAAIGIYGVLAFAVSQRQREFGIRMALGAERQRVLRMVLGQALALAAAGALLGMLAAAAATRAINSLLYGVHAFDPLAYGASALVLVGAVLAAAMAPAVRAMRVEPARVMRE